MVIGPFGHLQTVLIFRRNWPLWTIWPLKACVMRHVTLPGHHWNPHYWRTCRCDVRAAAPLSYLQFAVHGRLLLIVKTELSSACLCQNKLKFKYCSIKSSSCKFWLVVIFGKSLGDRKHCSMKTWQLNHTFSFQFLFFVPTSIWWCDICLKDIYPDKHVMKIVKTHTHTHTQRPSTDWLRLRTQQHPHTY